MARLSLYRHVELQAQRADELMKINNAGDSASELINDFIEVSVTIGIYRLSLGHLRSVIHGSIHPATFRAKFETTGMSIQHSYDEREQAEFVAKYTKEVRSSFQYIAKLSAVRADAEITAHRDIVESTISNTRQNRLMQILNGFAQQTSNRQYSLASSIGSAESFGRQVTTELQRLQAQQAAFAKQLTAEFPAMNERRPTTLQFNL